LNEAYAVLLDPFRRADYLATLEGGPSAADQKQAPPEFLEEMLDLRMRIEEAKAYPDPDTSERANLELALTHRRDGFLADVAVLFDGLEALPPDDPGRGGILVQIRQALNATKYVQGLLRDLEEE
jgi:molecular chaperone HscB